MRLAPELGGRRAVVPAEDLGELGGLAVAHRTGHDLDRKRAVEQDLGRPLHPHSLQLAAEARAAHLRQSALQLAAARGDLTGDPREREIRIAVLPRDDLEGLAVELAP